MLRKFSILTFYILLFIDRFIGLFSKRFKFLLSLKEFIEEKSYTTKTILNKNIKFFIPNRAIELRVRRYFTKEPATLEWINQFKNNQKIIFWDIGSNIGLFSIYAALRHEKIQVISFEPSTSNLRALSRNISINNLQEKIKINQFPLTDKENKYLNLKESRFQEGSASNTFGENFNFEGKDFNPKNEYSVYGTSINFLIRNNILEIPDYIKIDVDGIEHLILDGGSEYLSNDKIKSISVEINENFKNQFDLVQQLMRKNQFTFKNKNQGHDNPNRNVDNLNTYNYIFDKKTIK